MALYCDYCDAAFDEEAEEIIVEKEYGCSYVYCPYCRSDLEEISESELIGMYNSAKWNIQQKKKKIIKLEELLKMRGERNGITSIRTN